jgi:polysaccharide export outer membrane protein
VPQPFRLFVTVTGETGIQGRISIQPNSTLLDVIALAGGLTARASDTVYILRKDASGAIQRTAVHLDMREVVSSGSASSPALQTLQGGDTIVVPKGTFTIVGNISNRGEYRVETGMMVFQAIARAGGVTATGSERRITIRRVRPDGKIVDIKAKKDTRIEPDDLITVGERWF